MGLMQEEKERWSYYYSKVIRDYRELKAEYPYSQLTIPPTLAPSLASLRVVAANIELIQRVNANEKDFTRNYSRELYVIIPMDYVEKGCKVYWAIKKIRNRDKHFYKNEKYDLFGYELCVGTPDSFPLMPNVILENIRTAERMLIAYELVMTGVTNHLKLIAYSHGDSGRRQFINDLTRYSPERKM